MQAIAQGTKAGGGHVFAVADPVDDFKALGGERPDFDRPSLGGSEFPLLPLEHIDKAPVLILPDGDRLRVMVSSSCSSL